MFKQFLGVMLSLLLAVLAAMAPPASAQTAKVQAPAPNAKAVAVGDVGRSVSQAPDQEAKDQVKELAAEFKSMQAAVLEGQRKSIDWWFSFLGALVGALAVMFGALPLLLTRQQKADISKELEEAKNLVKSIQGHEKIAKESSVRTLDYFEGVARSSTEVAAVKAEAIEVARDPSASDSDKLRARAILAGQKTQPSAEQAQTAYELWAALALLNEQDDRAHANAGYWAQVLYELKAQPGEAFWLQATYKHYAQALNANPEKHEAAYNWGTALAAEADALCGEDLPLAQAKWREAGEKYAQALHIKPEKNEAANNWGNALAAEAKALFGKDLSLAHAKWREAGEKYAQALDIKPKDHEAPYNWGIALAAEADALCGEDLPLAQAKWREAGEKYAQALHIKPEKHEAANNLGNALFSEANALFGKDLPLAQAKWREAGEKYAQALHIKPEKHEAAYNWGICLLAEAQALLNKQAPDEAAASQCLTQAAQLLEKQAAMGQEGQEAVALTLAGTYSMQRRLNEALVQLEIARKANDLAASWQTSPTLKNLRATSEYQTWLNQHFPKKD